MFLVANLCIKPNFYMFTLLAYIKEQWLVDAAVRLNPKLKLSPKYQLSAIHAITRLDLSSNDLSEIPDIIFQMQSLKILCLAQNKIELIIWIYLGLSYGRRVRRTVVICQRRDCFPAKKIMCFFQKSVFHENVIKHYESVLQL